jgi:TRIAD3 protein (E3 ubiquitin-protein ligase RNF216)
VLDSKLMDLYDRVKQQKEIEDAGLEDLEECPFCEWKCEIEASKEEEKLFRCGNEEGGCGVVSCRMCKKEVGHFLLFGGDGEQVFVQDHLPKSCKGQLHSFHAI